MGGISSRSISFLICAVANASTPGSPAIIAGIGAEGLPTRFKWRWSIFFLLTMSSPQNVKNRRASTPAILAALARLGFGDPGDLRDELRRTIREEFVDGLDRCFRALADLAEPGARARLGFDGARRVDHFPMLVGELYAHLCCVLPRELF
jgi:hypothetical protein